MGDMGNVFNEYRAYKKERKQQFGMPCPDCIVRLPKAQPKILMPNQKCWCGYRDNRPRAAHDTKEKGRTENCAALADNCPDHLPPSLVGVGEIDSTSQPEQEPVGEARQMSEFVEGFTHCIWDARVIPVGTKLYTTPPQRTWIGLTPQERDEINEQVYGAVPHHVAFHHAIEARLKELNT